MVKYTYLISYIILLSALFIDGGYEAFLVYSFLSLEHVVLLLIYTISCFWLRKFDYLSELWSGSLLIIAINFFAAFMSSSFHDEIPVASEEQFFDVLKSPWLLVSVGITFLGRFTEMKEWIEVNQNRQLMFNNVIFQVLLIWLIFILAFLLLGAKEQLGLVGVFVFVLALKWIAGEWFEKRKTKAFFSSKK